MRYKVSYWDALILHAAEKLRSGSLFIETFHTASVMGR